MVPCPAIKSWLFPAPGSILNLQAIFPDGTTSTCLLEIRSPEFTVLHPFIPQLSPGFSLEVLLTCGLVVNKPHKLKQMRCQNLLYWLIQCQRSVGTLFPRIWSPLAPNTLSSLHAPPSPDGRKPRQKLGPELAELKAGL